MNQATRALDNQSFVKVKKKKKSDMETTVQLEEQLYSYQCSIEATIRSLANIASTLMKKKSTTQGQ